MAENALHQYLKTAAGAGLCTSIGCTTCGAREFRSGAVLAATGRRLHEYDARAALQMLSTLAEIVPADREIAALAPGIACLLVDAARVLGPLSPGPWLGASWAGRLYHDMVGAA